MNTKVVKSYDELQTGIATSEKSFLLLYKSGSEQSDCALNRISGKSNEKSFPLFVADVNQVRDIHPRLEVTTAPSLVVFYKNFSGTDLEFEGKEYLMMPYADILGRIVETDKI